MKVFCAEELLRELAERVIICEAGACMFVVDDLGCQKSCSEGPVQSNSALSSLFAMALESMANQRQGGVPRT